MTSQHPHVGVVLPRGASTGDGVREVAIAADRLGYDSIWSTEHIAIPLEITSRYPFSDDGVPSFRATAKWFEGMLVLAHVAALTTRVRLGTAVIPMFNRDPLSLAKQAATIDVLSGGRLELGLGAGWLAEEAAVLGHGSDKRGKRLDEAIEILRKAWTEHPVEHHGEFYDFPAVGVEPKPTQGGDIPIWIGGASPAALRTTVSRAQGNILWTQDVDEIRRLTDELKAARPDLQVAAAVYWKPDHAAAAEWALELAELGVDRIMLSPSGDLGRTLEWLDAFSEDVLPRLRGSENELASGAA